MSELSHSHAHAREHSHTRYLHTRAFTDTRVHASIRTRAHASIRTRSHAHTRAFAHAHNCPTPGICILLLYAIFFDSVLQIPVSKGSSVTGKFYRESVLTQLVDFYQNRRPCTSVRGIKLLHDNALAHKSATVHEYLKKSGLDVLDHHP